MGDPRTRLLGWWQQARDALASVTQPGNRHDPGWPAAAQWMVTVPTQGKPDDRGKHWRSDVVHTQFMPAVRRDAPTEVQVPHRPGWPK